MARRDWFTEAFGVGLTDIRQKLIDEAWFGRHPAEPRPHSMHEHHPHRECDEHDLER